MQRSGLEIGRDGMEPSRRRLNPFSLSMHGAAFAGALWEPGAVACPGIELEVGAHVRHC